MKSSVLFLIIMLIILTPTTTLQLITKKLSSQHITKINIDTNSSQGEYSDKLLQVEVSENITKKRTITTVNISNKNDNVNTNTSNSNNNSSPRHPSIEDIKRDLELLRNISKDRVIEALENDPTFKERVNGFKWELLWNDKAVGYVSRNGRILAIVANVVVYDENDKPVVGLILWLELHSLRVISIEEVPWIIFFVSSHPRIPAEENNTNNTNGG